MGLLDFLIVFWTCAGDGGLMLGAERRMGSRDEDQYGGHGCLKCKANTNGNALYKVKKQIGFR